MPFSLQAGDNLQFLCFHHHLTFMWGAHLKRKLRLEFNTLTTKEHIFDFFKDNYNITPNSTFLENSFTQYIPCTYDHFIPKITNSIGTEESTSTWNSNTSGKFFNEFTDELEAEDDCDLGSSFFAEM